MEAEQPDDAGPSAAEQTVEFGWEDDTPMGGRRLKKEREKKRKFKPGSFGTLKDPCKRLAGRLLVASVLLLLCLK